MIHFTHMILVAALGIGISDWAAQPVQAGGQVPTVASVEGGTAAQGNDSTGYRVAAGNGLRITVPVLGPVPVKLDFAFPIVKPQSDNRQLFNFYLGITR